MRQWVKTALSLNLAICWKHRSIPHYSSSQESWLLGSRVIWGRHDGESSDNVSGAVNQQERLDSQELVIKAAQDPESSETICQAPSSLMRSGKEMVRSAWRHAEPGRNVLAPGATWRRR